METSDKFGTDPIAMEMGLAGTESIKLMKNSKGYNWEIRILEVDIDRLEAINKKCIERWGSGDD